MKICYNNILNILFPRRCSACTRIMIPKGLLIHPDRTKELLWVRRPTCKRCGKEAIGDTTEYCYDCTRHKRSFGYGLPVINYDETASRFMAGIKYNNKREYLDFYAEAMLRSLGPRIVYMKADVLLPVPIHPSQMKTRGLNQAQELAVRLSEKLGIPVNSTILRCSKKTAPQKSLDPSGRLKNLEQVSMADHLPPYIHSVILVDDIYTTGSTIEARTRILKRAGIERVYFITIFISNGQ